MKKGCACILTQPQLFFYRVVEFTYSVSTQNRLYRL